MSTERHYKLARQGMDDPKARKTMARLDALFKKVRYPSKEVVLQVLSDLDDAVEGKEPETGADYMVHHLIARGLAALLMLIIYREEV